MLAQKKSKLISYIKIFRFLPFVETVFLTGSFALGEANLDSDFDLIIGTRQRRIFTARFFCLLIFSFLGLRRKGENKKDKVCFNHFVAEKNYFIEPYNDYLKNLFRRLAPLYGDEEAVKQFCVQNHLDYETSDQSFRSTEKNSGLKIFFQQLLASRLGDRVESILRKIQVWHIQNVVKNSGILSDKVRWNENEIGNFGFYLDTKKH